MHPIIISVRFSLFQINAKGFKQRAGVSPEAFKAQLLDEARLHKMQDYLERGLDGFAVSFGAGFEGLIENGRVVRVRDKYFPKIALGLALMSKEPTSVYSFGGHVKLDENVPVILDAREPMYIRGIHGDNDSGRSWADDDAGQSIADLPDLTKAFPFL